MGAQQGFAFEKLYVAGATPCQVPCRRQTRDPPTNYDDPLHGNRRRPGLEPGARHPLAPRGVKLHEFQRLRVDVQRLDGGKHSPLTLP